MNVSSASSLTAPALTSASVKTPSSAAPQRTADGDYKTRSFNTSQTKDVDGDYKPLSAAAKSSAAVQSALLSQKVGG